MRALALATALLALAPAAAPAAPFAATPFHALGSDAGCLRATGAPGELAVWAPSGARLLHAAATGLSEAGTVKLGAITGCPEVAAQPDGAGIAAAAVEGGIAVSVRDPGGAWSTPATISAGSVAELSTAVSDRGDAVVAWHEFGLHGAFVRAARRAPAGVLGAPETLGGAGESGFSTSLETGIGSDGAAIVVWPTSTLHGHTLRTSMLASIGAAGAGFTPAQRFPGEDGGASALAVAPDGRALAAYSSSDGTRVTERLPGGAFGPPRLVTGSGTLGAVAVAQQPDGAAIVASGGTFFEPLVYARRQAGGEFGPPLLAAQTRASLDSAASGAVGSLSGGSAAPGLPADITGGSLRAALAPDGRVLLAWADVRLYPGPASSVHAVVVNPDGSAGTTRLGGPLRDVAGTAPLLLDGGAFAVAWADNAQSGAGRVQLVAEGALPPLPPRAPRVEIGRPARTVVPYRQPLVVPVKCSSACDLRARLSTGASQTVSLANGGTVRLRLGGAEQPAAPRRGGIVTLTVDSSAPGAHTVRTRTLRLRLRRPTPPPQPRMFALTATQSEGGALVVRWRTDRSARGYRFRLSASADSSFRSTYGAAENGTAKTSYEVRLPRVTERLRYVRLQLYYEDGGVRTLRARVNAA